MRDFKTPTVEKLKTILQPFLFDGASIETESDLFDDLGLDSLEVMDLVVTVEDEFKITFEDSEVKELRKVNEVLSLIETKLETRSA